MQMRAILFVCVIIATLSLAGCLIVPADHYKGYSRENVSEEPSAGIVPGTTTREEVLMRLGEPDRASEDESEFWYMASKVKGGIIVGYSGSDIVIDYIHAIGFDRNGRVETVRLMKTDSIEKYEFWSNELVGGNFGISYTPEPHFSRPPISVPTK